MDEGNRASGKDEGNIKYLDSNQAAAPKRIALIFAVGGMKAILSSTNLASRIYFGGSPKPTWKCLAEAFRRPLAACCCCVYTYEQRGLLLYMLLLLLLPPPYDEQCIPASVAAVRTATKNGSAFWCSTFILGPQNHYYFWHPLAVRSFAFTASVGLWQPRPLRACAEWQAADPRLCTI